MKKKIVGIFVCMLLIATVVPSVASIKNSEKNTNDSNYSLTIFTKISENQPLTPPNITGPHYGKINTWYTFSLGLITEDQFYISWNWGDGSSSEWFGPYYSGATINASHAWSKPGNYTIKIKLRDNNGTESESTPFSITIVKLKLAFFLGFFENFNQTDDLLIMEGRTFIVFPSHSILYKGEIIVISKGYLGHLGASFIF
jgi:hypothetical protein